MINLDDFVEIGTLRKTHGTKGELSLSILCDIPEDADCLMLLVDNIPVPFYIEDWRYKSDDILLLKLEDVDTEQSAKRFIGCRVYADRHLFRNDSSPLSPSSVIGYSLIDKTLGLLGTVSDIDTSTINTLLLLSSGDVLPLHEDLVISIDDNKKEILMNLPKGIL